MWRGLAVLGGRLPIPAQMSLSLTLPLAMAVVLGWFGDSAALHFGGYDQDQIMVLGRLGFWWQVGALAWLGKIGVWMLAVGVGLAWWRRRLAMTVIKVALAYGLCIGALGLVVFWQGPALLHAAESQTYHKYLRTEAWIRTLCWWLPVVVGSLIGALLALRRQMVDWYAGEPAVAAEAAEKARGDSRAPWGLSDRLLQWLRTGGRDPEYNSSVWWSGALHVAVLILVPILLRGCGWEEPYHIPKGEGEQVVMAKMKRVKKKVEKKKLILSMNTDILFYRPDPNESDMLQETDLITQNEYEARGVEGKQGASGGKAGGWPEGMPGRVRFIRLEYDGGDWDQDLHLAADDNMLFKLGEMTGLAVANNAEQRGIARLRFFPEGKAPPFVFVTGRGGMNLSNHEAKVLREYCLTEGGMIFADNGGGTFNSSFRSAMKRVFPEKNWVTVSNDDPIFQYPYLFPTGAPPLWHHSGREAVGLRHNGRWICFYHQGDLNDAWKTGHSGIHEGLANQAYKLGVNVVYYAFNQYLAFHRE